MELGTIGGKSIVLIYIIMAVLQSESALSPWVLLTVLLYLCMNTAIYLIKSATLKPAAIVLALAGVIAVSLYIHPFWALLLPAHLYELVSHFRARNGLALAAMAAPALALPHDLILQYGLIALFSFAYFTILRAHTDRIGAFKQETDRMRSRIDHLRKQLDENNEYIKQSEYTFKLEERNRMSQEIHDRIGHSMTGALIQMEAAKRLSASDPDKSAELLQNAILISKDGIESIRQVLKNMKPATEQLGVNRLRLLIDEFSAKHAIRATLTHEGNIDVITPLQWKIVLENVQEALTNTMKYSKADAIAVRIQVLGTLIRAEIADNGQGAAKVIKGLGIRGMEERTASLNGTVIIDGSRGFSVTTLLPHNPPPESSHASKVEI